MEIILTHCGKLGDMLYGLMVGSWLHKTYGRKIHWVLPEGFGPFRHITNLLMAQEQTSRVTLVPHQIKDFSCGGQPYKFDPAVYGITGEYFNLGFRGYPDKFLPAYYAEEYGLCYDPDFILLAYDRWLSDEPILATGKKLRSSELAMQMLMPDVEPLPTSIDLLTLLHMLLVADEFHAWFCGMAVLAWMANLPAHVYRVAGHAPMELYFPQTRLLTIHELPIHPKDMAQI